MPLRNIDAVTIKRLFSVPFTNIAKIKGFEIAWLVSVWVIVLANFCIQRTKHPHYIEHIFWSYQQIWADYNTFSHNGVVWNSKKAYGNIGCGNE